MPKLGLKEAETKKITPKKVGNSVKILGVGLNSASFDRVLKKIIRRLDAGQKTFVVTPNPEFLVFAHHQPWFKSILSRADVAIPDGMGLVWASRFLAFRPLVTFSELKTPRRWANALLRGGKEKHARGVLPVPPLRWKAIDTSGPPVIQERISGADLMERLCQEAAQRSWRIYLLGGEPGVAKKALVVLKKRYSGLEGWAGAGPRVRHLRGVLPAQTSPSEKECWRGSLHLGGGKLGKWVEKINQKQPDLLFVAFGMAKQEKFIWDNWDRLNVRLAMGVGGAFDYLSGQVPRAPKPVRQLGFEWLYRLFCQPWRWRRQLALLEFCWLVFRNQTREDRQRRE